MMTVIAAFDVDGRARTLSISEVSILGLLATDGYLMDIVSLRADRITILGKRKPEILSHVVSLGAGWRFCRRLELSRGSGLIHQTPAIPTPYIWHLLGILSVILSLGWTANRVIMGKPPQRRFDQ